MHIVAGVPVQETSVLDLMAALHEGNDQRKRLASNSLDFPQIGAVVADLGSVSAVSGDVDDSFISEAPGLFGPPGKRGCQEPAASRCKA